MIDWAAKNWIPLFKYHLGTYITQIVIGLIFTGLWFIVFRYLILRFNFKTPGREDDSEETKLYRKSDYKAMKKRQLQQKDAKRHKSKKIFRTPWWQGKYS